MTELKHENNGESGTFTLFYEGLEAGHIEYTVDGRTMVITHTEVDEKFGGKGFGKDLVMAAAAFAKQQNLKIKPVCSFAKRTLEKEQYLQEYIVL